MAALSYEQPGLEFGKPGTGANDQQIRDLQRDLRQLGYLRRGIDGAFGGGTESAVLALRHDLLNNDGSSRGGDGQAPVAIRDYNADGVAEVTGLVDQGLAGCIARMLADDNFPKLPFADDAAAQNEAVRQTLRGLVSKRAPVPFLLAMLTQESNLEHFREPRGGDEDSYIVVGLDRNDDSAPVITSRGYGVGQYTLFHHPPRPEEVDDFIVDPVRNLSKAIEELREKQDVFVNGNNSKTRADDRIAEVGAVALRYCKFADDDPRFMNDCRACAAAAGTQDIVEGVTRRHPNTDSTYDSTQYYDYVRPDFAGIPLRKDFECDWPYAARRYNGAGPNSYSYQALILRNLLRI